MTPEEIQKAQEEAQQAQAAQAAPAGKVRLNNSSVTTHGDKVSETTHGDKVTTTTHDPKTTIHTERSVNGFVNPDGTPNEAAEREFQRQQKLYADAHHIDTKTGQVDRRFVSDILGVDPEVMRKQREAEMALNRRKQKESAWYNALSVLGDMVTTATGGNVWKREADTHAKEAHDDNLKLQKEQAAEDEANNNKLRAPEKEYAAAMANLYDTVGKSYGTKISTTTEQEGDTKVTTTQGNDKTTTTQGRDVTTGHRDAISSATSNTSTSNKSSSNTTAYLPIKVNTANGKETYRLAIPKAKKDAIANELANVLSRQPEYTKKYAQYVITTGSGTKKETTIDLDRLINDGVYIDNPNIINTFITELQRSGVTNTQGKLATRAQIYEMITGDTITDERGQILPDRVLQGVTINGVQGRKVGTTEDDKTMPGVGDSNTMPGVK